MALCSLLLWTGCGDDEPEVARLVNVQLTEIDDPEALSTMVDELDARGIRASIMVEQTMATQFCDDLRAYDQRGHEIMVYGRPPAPPDAPVYLADLSLEDQRQLLDDTKAALEACLGHPVRGMRSYQFSHDEDTWTVMDELGLELNLSYIAGTENSVPGFMDEEWPHRVPGHSFWAVPLHSAPQGDRVSPLCDMPFRSATAEEWSATVRSEMDATLAAGRPFKVLFHSYYTARDPGRMDAFIAFLDHARASGAELVTAAELVALTPLDEPNEPVPLGGGPALLETSCDE